MITIKYIPKLNKAIALFPYDPNTVLLVKSLGASSVYIDHKFDRWEFDLKPETAETLTPLKLDKRFEIDPAVFAAIETAQEWRAQNYALSMATDADIDTPLSGVLKDYQRAAVKYNWINSKGVLNGDQMGLGKTLETLATLEHGKMYPALIICPAVVKYAWARECAKWIPGRRVVVINGYKNKLNDETDAEIYIINYDIIQKYWEFLIHFPWDTLVCDESHYLKNYQAKRTLLVQELAKQVRHKFLLSGTPVLNRPSELLPQLTILDLIKDFGGFWPFANRYCRARKTRFGWDLSGADHLDELNIKLRELGYIRREKSEVLKELPEKTRIDLWMKIDNGPEYEQAQKDIIGYLEEHARLEADFLETIKELPENEQARLISDYRMDKANRARRAELLVKMNTLKQIAARGKIKTAQAWIDNYFENGGTKLVIFAWHTEIVAEIVKLYGCNSITGDVSAEDRDQHVQNFQNNPNHKILVCNIQAGGVGITLTAADTSLFLEQGWNPGTMEQAEDRIHRIGQNNPVSIYYMLAEGTIDVANWNLIEEKRGVVNSTTDGFNLVRDYLLMKKEK